MAAPTATEPEIPTRPPAPHASPGRWVRTHLFRTWYDGLLTILFGGLFVWAGTSLVRFLLNADFTILRVNLALFMVGRFPRDQLWRPAVALVLLAILAGFLLGVATASARARALESGIPFQAATPMGLVARFWPALATVGMILLLTETPGPALAVTGAFVAGIAARLAAGRAPAWLRGWAWLIELGLVVAIYRVLVGGGVTWNNCGGLHLNLFLTIAGILFAFPLGLLLALGRRSSLPAVRWMSVTYIELIRGVPLITLLLMGVFALGFFLPDTLRPGPIVRVLVAITLFEAAYIAEVVRGGLQAVPHGQVEASQALGMPAWKTTRLIVLPQALRATIPAMVGQFISLYKDTTLVLIVGQLDLLSVSGVANSQPAFLAQGLEVMTLAFVALLFWVGSYVMSREARRLEKRLGVGER
jgi:general L-amino acid transport system permease protein